MGIYTSFKDGVVRETTFGTTAIAASNVTAYIFGQFSQDAIHPDPKTEIHYRMPGINTREVPAGERHKGVFKCDGFWGIALQSGVILEAIMGKSSTTGTDPYTHTITTPTDGTMLPSFTVQHEATGTATAWATQYLGSKIAALTLEISEEHPFLLAGVDWLAREATDPGFVLDATPAGWATANTEPYTWQQMNTRTFNAAEITGLNKVELTIDAGMMPVYVPWWDGATYKGRWPYSFQERPRRDYRLILTLSPGSDDMWDELVATGNTKDCVFKWTRSTNDYIQITASDCDFIDHPQMTLYQTEPYLPRVTCKPRSLSIEVKDSIAGSAYGE